MLLETGTNIIETIQNFINSLTQDMNFTVLSVIFLGVFGLVTLITWLRIRFTAVEVKTNKAINKIADYLAVTPYITEENLVEFNNLMKRIPESMRVQWQNYMLNRNEKPSKYINQHNVVENPLKTSKFKSALMHFNLFSGLLGVLGFVINLASLTSQQMAGYVLFQALLIPLALLILAIIFNIIFAAWKNTVTSNCFMTIDQLAKFLDRACSTMPPYVDYEILFTKKEISRGIPALQEYLQQRAQFEQEELQKASQSEVEHENYDFSELGVNGALVMERALKECEFFLGNRRRYLQEIEQIESEKDMLTRNYDDKNKTTQRKLRDIKETLDRLKDKLDNTTNKIVANDIRRQQGEEIKKQQAVEKEMEDDNAKYQRELQKLDDEVTNRRGEIDKARKFVENALNGEFKEYANKIYADIKTGLDEQYSTSLSEYAYEKMDIEQRIEERDKYVAERDALYQEKVTLLEQYAQALQDRDTEIRMLHEQLNDARNTVHKRDAGIKRELDSKIDEIQVKDRDIYNKMQIIKDQDVRLDEMRTTIEQLEGQIAIMQQSTQRVQQLEAELANSQQGDARIKELEQELSNLQQKANRVAILEQELANSKQGDARVKELEKRIEELQNQKPVTQEIYRYFDGEGREFFIDENDVPYYLDDNGKKHYYDDDDAGALKENQEKIETAKKQTSNVDELQRQIDAENKKLQNEGKKLQDKLEKANNIDTNEDPVLTMEDVFGKDIDINEFNEQINNAISQIEKEPQKTVRSKADRRKTTKARNAK